MSNENAEPKATYRYAVHPAGGPIQMFGPYEARVTYYGQPEESDADDETDRKSA